MEERIKKAFDFAADLTKQLITLATGMIALTISFQKEILGGHLDGGAKSMMKAAWALYIFSLFCGIWMLMALTGSLEPKSTQENYVPSIRGANAVLPSVLQILAFLTALVLTALAAAASW
ncbi:MAG TPA: hypothetical protein VF532_10165 [Candidatus Angelobacter sp.]